MSVEPLLKINSEADNPRNIPEHVVDVISLNERARRKCDRIGWLAGEILCPHAIAI